MSKAQPSKRAVILAGGKGTRLRPYTVVFPKPLMPIGEYPILEVVIRQLANHGFSRVTIAVNHQANLIQAFFGDGSQWGIEIDYSLELEPLSTIGPVRLIPDLPEHFLLMNGDVLSDLDFGGFLEEHTRSDALFTISAARRFDTIDYGVLHTTADGLLDHFEEKPKKEFLVSMGVYAVSRKILERVPIRKKYGFDDLMYEMIRESKPVKVKIHDGYWLDIGRPDDYARAIDDFEKERARFLGP